MEQLFWGDSAYSYGYGYGYGATAPHHWKEKKDSVPNPAVRSSLGSSRMFAVLLPKHREEKKDSASEPAANSIIAEIKPEKKVPVIPVAPGLHVQDTGLNADCPLH